MSDAEAEVFLWIIGIFMGLVAVCFGLFLIGDSCGYSCGPPGSGGNSDPDNPWLQL